MKVIAYNVCLCRSDYFTQYDFSMSVHVAVNGIISSFFMAEWYSMVYVYHIFFMLFSVHGHLGCTHVLTAVSTLCSESHLYISWFLIYHVQWPLSEATLNFLKISWLRSLPIWCTVSCAWLFTAPWTVARQIVWSSKKIWDAPSSRQKASTVFLPGEKEKGGRACRSRQWRSRRQRERGVEKTGRNVRTGPISGSWLIHAFSPARGYLLPHGLSSRLRPHNWPLLKPWCSHGLLALNPQGLPSCNDHLQAGSSLILQLAPGSHFPKSLRVVCDQLAPEASPFLQVTEQMSQPSPQSQLLRPKSHFF